jgi:hypothetical protein
MLSECARKVFRLRIVLDSRYPGIINECKDAIRNLIEERSAKVGQVSRIGCFEINAYWKHWPCMFPQHGPGPKHLRRIALAQWQQEMVDLHPGRLLRGLIHSDGSRDLNFVNGKSYPRYSFSNVSRDIQAIFCETCDELGVHWTKPFWKTVAISKRPDVERRDTFIGAKQ